MMCMGVEIGVLMMGGWGCGWFGNDLELAHACRCSTEEFILLSVGGFRGWVILLVTWKYYLYFVIGLVI